VAPVKISYDARGLAEPDAQAPCIAKIEGEGPGRRAVFDAADLSTRLINLELRRLAYAEQVGDVTIQNPGAKHSIAVGILTRCRITIEGSLGYFGCGLIDGPEIRVTGRVGWSVAENMMSGVVVIDKNAGSLAGAALRGGDLVVRGDVGARTGIDQKGGTILVGGNAGTMTGFMLQRGRQIICGNVGGGLGDSMYDGAIYVGGSVASLGVDCVEAALEPADHELLERKLRIYGIPAPASFRKFVCGRKLWNYDNLEPAERKLVL
jgi:methylamine---glutamate N-methyltransferase subunit B